MLVVAGFKYIHFKIIWPESDCCFVFVVKYLGQQWLRRLPIAMLLLLLFLSFPLSRACLSRIGPFRRYLQLPYLIGASSKKDSAKPWIMCCWTVFLKIWNWIQAFFTSDRSSLRQAVSPLPIHPATFCFFHSAQHQSVTTVTLDRY